MAISSEIPASPYSPPPSSEVSDVPTSPDTNPSITTSEAIYSRLNVVQTNFRRLISIRDTLKKRIDSKLEAHNLMFASRAFSLEYKIALTKHLNDFLEPLYNDLEETEVQLDEADARMTHIFHVLASLESQYTTSSLDEKKEIVVKGWKRKRDGNDGNDSNNGEDTDVVTDVVTDVAIDVDTGIDTEVNFEEDKNTEEKDQNDEVV